MKLNEAIQVNEINNEYITLVDTNGNHFENRQG